ncbi:transposase [uncultured Amaricoccus sp.]|uniref:transposase n=1 Tax=uncultured Amaricoccus sp. TaxID=339341 RepID=UPI00345861F0
MIGIDDFAWRRGHGYGSIVIDLERRTVIDILPDRQSDTVMAWLKENPQVRIICRDRGPGLGPRPRRRRPRPGRWRIAGICSGTPPPPSLPRSGPSCPGCARRCRPNDPWIQRLRARRSGFSGRPR